MAKEMEDIKRMICEELEEIAQKGEMSAGDLDVIYKLVVTKEKLLRIEEIEEEMGYSQDGMSYEGSYGRRSNSNDNSYDRASRNSYGRGNSYARRDSKGRYSRDGLRDKMMELMESGDFSNSQRQSLQRVIDEMQIMNIGEINREINELLKSSVQSDGVISLFDSKAVGETFNLFDPEILGEIAKMKEKNIAVEILKNLIAEQVFLYKRTNVVQSQKFSEKLTELMNSYYNGLITNEKVIQELLDAAKEIADMKDQGKELGLTEEELAFYDALTKPEAIKDFYENDELVALTKELTETIRKNSTIDWQRKETARAGMRKMVKHLLKKYKYPPEGVEDAVQTVISQCELWTDNEI